MFTHAAPLLAFGFMNLPLLGWLAAAAAPILIHLWMRRKYREAPWAAMEYLLAALRRQSRRLHFEQWLLLAVRTLLVMLVVLAVAEPYLERPLLSLAPGGRTHRVLVLDGSFSMAYQPADQTRFDRAKEIAREIVESAPAGDAFTLLLMTSPPQVVVGTPALAGDEVAAELEALRQPHTTADLPAVVPRIREVIAAAQRESPRLVHHEVIFLTDLQRAAWAPRGSSSRSASQPSFPGSARERTEAAPRSTPDTKSAQAELQRQMGSLAETATLVLIDVGQPSADNLAVADVRLLTAPAIAGRTCRFEVTVKSFAAQPAGRQAVELLVDGRRVAQRHVEVPAGGEASVLFEHRFDRPGDRAVEVRAEGDALAVDNRRYLAVPVRRSVSILCIEGRPSGKPFGGAADYLAVALAPADEPGLASPIEVEVASESAILERDLSRYDVLAMCNVAQFTAGEADVLSAYLRGGGSLLVFLGDQVMPERYNRELGPGAREDNRLLPAELGPAVDTPEGRLDPLEYRHPMLDAFRGAEHAGLLTTPVDRHIRLTVPKDGPARVALRLPGGDPLIVEQPFGRGRVVLAATSADTSWTPMPLLPSFVPLVQEMAAFCLADGMTGRNVTAGEPLRGIVAAAGGQGAVDLRTPEGERREVRLTGTGNQREWTFPATWRSGVYAVRLDTPDEQEMLFAVNVDTAGSDLAQIGLERLRGEVLPAIPFEYKTTWQEPDRPQTVALRGGPGRLHVALLGAALALLLAETFLAWKFGHQAQP